MLDGGNLMASFGLFLIHYNPTEKYIFCLQVQTSSSTYVMPLADDNMDINIKTQRQNI